jgi:hypothetical protein
MSYKEQQLLGEKSILQTCLLYKSNFKIIFTWKNCQRTISTQKLKLLGEVSGYDLYYSLTHPLK